MKTVARTTNDQRQTTNDALKGLGVFGFAEAELPILAALVTEDPLLLIGNSGTGKTYLLNSISEALGLEHRHYNASLVSFDDLVGFPYPDDEKASVRFLETPATVWGAESVLIDEISRCRPEHQNRLFSLIHERRVQGIALPRLRFRWAAMNPCTTDHAMEYAGSEPLDQALADRFALVVNVVDWDDLEDADRLAVANPSGEGAVSDDGGALARRLAQLHAAFVERVERCPEPIVAYACAAATALNDAGIRISPRRVRLLARSLLAGTLVAGKGIDETVFRAILRASIPHRAWGAEPSAEHVLAAHRLAWDSACLKGTRRWIHEFHLEKRLPKKVARLLGAAPDADSGTLALCQCLATERPARAAVLAFALFPAAVQGKLPIGAEAVNDLGKLAQPLLQVNADISWQERLSESGTQHPEFARLAPLLAKLGGARQRRARQLFYWAIANGVALEDPEGLERDLEACVALVGRCLK
ncbi:MAG: MoxR family ATPase [Fimbriimonadaceae bacterium]|nr:AAA family ATPase [Chthonomonadaceae bacterium]MCO5298046.1 MoxR family ATPase [Fimbriimonadaceae bacterium]